MAEWTDGTWVTLISLTVTFLFMLGVPVLLVISYWIIGCSFVLGLTLDNMGAELLNVFNKGFALAGDAAVHFDGGPD